MREIQLGSKLQALRKAKNYTAMELAEKINVSQAYISKIENDKASPNMEMLSRILDALDSDIYTFFAQSREEVSDEFIQCYELFKTVNPEVRGKLIELMELIR